MTSTATAMPNAKHLLKGLLAGLACLLLALAFVPAAMAAPSFAVSVEHFTAISVGSKGPLGSISRSDTMAFFDIKVKNTTSTTATCQRKTWTGTPAPTFSYQWLRDGAPIAGATSETYVPGAADNGRSLQCQVTTTNTGGASTQVTAPIFYGQAPNVPVPPPAPGNALNEAARPTITGTTELTCVAPTNWNGGPTWTYQWLRNGLPIAGATTDKYTPQSGAGEEDQDKVLQCMIIGTNAVGKAAGISSNRLVGSPTTPPANTAANNPITIGAEWVSGTTNVAIDVPMGVTIVDEAGTGWSCTLSTRRCVTTQAAAPGATLPTLTLKVVLFPFAPDTVTMTAVASGGSSLSEALGQDSFTFTPATLFSLVNFDTAAVDENEVDVLQAGSHPFVGSARLEVARNSINYSVGDIHEIWTDLPVGFVGNPLSVPTACSLPAFETLQCPEASAAGIVKLRFSGSESLNDLKNPLGGNLVYRLPPEKGYPAEFGFNFAGVNFVFRARIRTDGDYGLTVIAPKTPQLNFAGPLSGARFSFCGYGVVSERCKKVAEPGANSQPLLTIGTKCFGETPKTVLATDSWQNPGRNLPSGLPDLTDPNWKHNSFTANPVLGCEQLTEEWVGEKEPTLSIQPETHQADSPAGYTAKLHIPQDGLTDPDGLATSHLRNVSVTLGEGISLNPSVGDGIDVCSMDQMGALTEVGEIPPHFDVFLPKCPDGSKIGTARIDTPVLENPLRGSIYLAPQDDNPFGADYAIYLVVEEPDTGIVVKLAGKVNPDPKTGQIRTVFTENPELPFEGLKLDFFGGGRAAIANPQVCGTFNTTNELMPWSAENPFNPQPDEIARPTDPITINQGPNGSACVNDVAKRPFDLGLTAGSRDPIAGAKSPFSIRITRPDGNQEISKLEISPPPGFVASLKGIPYCSEAQIAAAAQNKGKAEQKTPSCPVASEVGQTNSAAGAGKTPFYAPGKLYLAGPYKGETLSVVAITPAVAGPFDLGNVVIRSALKLDSRTARITAVTDEIPQLIKGIPLRIRDIRINLDRPNWAQNPTNCEAMSVDVTALGANGAISKPSNRFQVGGCEKLGFKPKLQIHLIGGTKRGDHPALLAKLKTRPGDANIARAAVTLPPSAFLDQSHIRTICTRVQFAANNCPKASIYGSATATTQLLDDPIKGNVFLRSSDNKLPDLVGALRGVANIDAVGRIDSIGGGIRNTFDIVPDAPFDVFVLKMQGGNKGLVVNSQNLCAKAHKATVKLTAHNGKQFNYRPKVIADGCAKGKKAKKGKRGHGKRR